MTTWTLHWLQANGSLSPWEERIASEIRCAEDALAAVMPPRPLDILLSRRASYGVIPELGIGGWTFGPTLVQIGFDTDADVFELSLFSGVVQRLIVHEVNHTLRFGLGPRQSTLGEAVVAEGLAGHFVSHVLGTPPELWDVALTEAELERHMPDRAVLDQVGYDHAAWFFGSAQNPRWLGYSLGYLLVGRWLEKAGGNATPEDRFAIDTKTVLDTALSA